jgi:hypothetical protein
MPQHCGTNVILQQLPIKWSLCNSDVLWQAMQLLMSGYWFKTHLTKLAAELAHTKLACPH